MTEVNSNAKENCEEARMRGVWRPVCAISLMAEILHGQMQVGQLGQKASSVSGSVARRAFQISQVKEVEGALRVL